MAWITLAAAAYLLVPPLAGVGGVLLPAAVLGSLARYRGALPWSARPTSVSGISTGAPALTDEPRTRT